MLTQELSIKMGAMLPQITDIDWFIRSFALRVLYITPHESLWDITNRVCDRYLGTKGPSSTSVV